MASSSSSTSSSLAPETLPRRKNCYDVFVSFRGEDTRNNFTDFLFDALQRKGIFAFRDDTNLQKGESIGPGLLHAINDSLVFVVVFSRNYASSTWCLQELTKILECHKLYGKLVLPVFYDVDPSEVRHQRGIYGEAFAKHEQRFQQNSQMVLTWRDALTQVANLSGWDLRDKPQSTEIKKIVKVLGSFLCGRDISEWRSALSRLRESPYKDVMDVLQLSFDGLEQSEKEIFLHIACFFNLASLEYVKNVLNCCEFHVDIALRVLIDKSLISIDDEWIEMHALLEEFGKKIVQENSSKEKRKWSRLWFEKQLYDVLMENMGKHVEAIVLDNENNVADDEVMDVAIFEHFSNLRLLIIKYVDMSGNLGCLSNKLLYVEWLKYPSMCLPSTFHPNHLVELILKSSSIKQLWEDKKYLPNLRILDLSNSKNLIKMPHFEDFPNLERLNLEGCVKLGHLDPSIGLLRHVVSLNLRYCKNLVSIPNNIFGLSSLKYLDMSGCFKVSFNKHLNISESASHSQSTMSSIDKNLFPTFHSLRELDISFCGLSQVPDAIGCLCWLERLNLGGNNFVTLPSLKEFSKLVYLKLDHCKLLKSMPKLPFPTTTEHDLHMTNIHKNIILHRKGLIIFNCPQLSERECCSSMTLSWMIQFIQANPQSSSDNFDKIQVVTPGSEMPSWFNNQNKGDSIRIDSSPIMHDYNNNVIGIACCVVFSMVPTIGSPLRLPGASMSLRFSDNMSKPFNQQFVVNNINDKMLMKGFTHLSVILNVDLITDKSHHIWIIYFPGKMFFDFLIRNGIIIVGIVHGENLGMEVKNCGYRWVYKQDLQEFNLTMMQPENSLSRKRKLL